MRLEPLIAEKFEMKGSEKSRQSLLDKTMNIIIVFIGLCAEALLIYYVYILMKGDEQK